MNFPNFGFTPFGSMSSSANTNGIFTQSGNAGMLFGTPAVQASVSQIATVSNLPSSLAVGHSVGVHSHGLGVNYSNMDSINRNVQTMAANMNLYNNNKVAVSANAFRNEVTLKDQNNYKVHQNGVGLDAKHISGHGVGVTAVTTPNHGTNYSASGTANVWKSDDKKTSLDVIGTVSRQVGGANHNKNSAEATVKLTQNL